MDFCYTAKAEEIDKDGCKAILASINKFYQHKSGIMDAEAQVGKGNRPINNWYIPKLKLMQSVVPNIQANGVAFQYSADVTEHAHITKIKNPTCSGNNQNYKTQICHDLDCTDKLHQFNLATSICESYMDSSNESKDHSSSETNILQQADSSADNDNNVHIPLAWLIAGLLGSFQNYFDEALYLQNDPQALCPLHTFMDGHTDLHLNCNPSSKQMTIDKAAVVYGIPDLCPALMDFIHHYTPTSPATVYSIGAQHTTAAHVNIGPMRIQVWFRVQLQSRNFHNAGKVLPLQFINACPPCDDWPLGFYDPVIINTDGTKIWPQSGLNGSYRFSYSWYFVY